VTIRRYSRQTFYLIAAFIVFIALLWTTAARAQDLPEPTSAPIVTPVAPDVPVENELYVETIEQLAELIEVLIENGGAAALAEAPLWLVIGICVGLGLGFVITRLTPNKSDDATFDRLFNRLLQIIGLGRTTAATITVQQSAPDKQTPPMPEGPA
jgi:hypothetical protein